MTGPPLFNTAWNALYTAVHGRTGWTLDDGGEFDARYASALQPDRDYTWVGPGLGGYAVGYVTADDRTAVLLDLYPDAASAVAAAETPTIPTAGLYLGSYTDIY